KFINDMAAAYAAADLVVSRAGASSISELQNLGKPCILVPSPNVAEDHQTKNALALADRGAAVMVTDADAPHELVDTIFSLIGNKEKLATMKGNISEMALTDSDDKIVEEIVRIVKEKQQ
ncbi:MAG: UDP-N-acetylglucosamine--N-acetylmuramyl-(pentapeptide) pyrophosphoryl-undecaprenol N-acetylglucosamine transferase, partial [Muribaculaceae bacterium]|nr:UDP-N-acetylglucosamine--N-acetylmuramyl-(pentapeptide) pyrophosphoryl-undecaprenol N-acetylglucosamine transferase [Muribaculaceae bacterium]